MNHTFEIEELEDRARWLQDFYDKALEGFFNSIEWGLSEAKREVGRREIQLSEEDARLTYTYSDQAGYTIRTILQAVSNAQADRLAQTAADLDEVKRAILARQSYLKSMPAGLREQVEIFDTERRIRKDEAARAKQEAAEKKQRERCKFTGYNTSCNYKGVEEIDGQVYCKRHAKLMRDRKARAEERSAR